MKKTIFQFYHFVAQLHLLQKKTDTLEKTKEIQEIILKSQKKKQFADRAVYTFDKEALEKARYAKDLLRTLTELQLDPISNTLKSTKRRNFFIFNQRNMKPAICKSEAYNLPMW